MHFMGAVFSIFNERTSATLINIMIKQQGQEQGQGMGIVAYGLKLAIIYKQNYMRLWLNTAHDIG